jgi:hypothetical protein
MDHTTPQLLTGVRKVPTLPVSVVPFRARRIRLERTVRTVQGLHRAARFGIKHRRRLAPAYAAALVDIAGGAMHLAPGGVRSAATADVAAAIALAWWIRRRTRNGRGLSRRELFYALVNTGAALALLMTMTLVGPWAPPVPGFTFLWFLAVLGGPWWWHHRIRPIAETEAETEDEWVRIWRESIAAPGRRLPDSALIAPEGIEGVPGAWKALIDLPPGLLTVDDAISAAVKIAGAYDVPLSSVVIERTETGSERRAHLSVYPRNPLQQLNYWPGPSAFNPETGISMIGVYADAIPVEYQHYKPGSGAVHSLISGSSDSGKSRLLDELLATERHADGLIVSRVVDPQRGQSLPDWQDNVDHFADSATEGVIELLVMRDVMLGRNERYASMIWTDHLGRTRKGKGSFEPGRVADGRDPLYSLTIDEAHDVFSCHPLAVEAAEDIALMGRKCGCKLRLVTQMPLLSQLGNSSPLRDSVASGNVIVLRTSSGLSGQVAFQSSFDVSPNKLPRLWPDKTTTSGLGYALGPQARPSVMRTSLIDDVFGWATKGETWHLGPEDRAVAELSYAKWAAILKDGARTPQQVVARTFSPQKMPAQTPAAAKAARTTYKAAILAHLDTVEYAYTGAIALAVDAPLSTASTTLARLAEEGLVQNIKRGSWATAKTPAEAVA